MFMIRQIISIDREKCNGCGSCADACNEGAIAMINGKAKLVREDHCDGLGNCLPVCPVGAITFVTREALPFNDDIIEDDIPMMAPKAQTRDSTGAMGKSGARWPIQMKLLPLEAPFLKDADILVAADCTAFVRSDFHNEVIKNKVVLIGCPKLDREDYGQRLSVIFEKNNVRSVTLARIDLPCCTALARMVKEAIASVPRKIPLETVVLSTDGNYVK